jgi:inosine-uridine nucleoside N-ribohydrolase
MKKIYGYTLCLLFIFVLPTGCHTGTQEQPARKIILDVDTSVDDMMAILYFLGCPDIEIKAITIVNGVSNVDAGAEIVLRLLNLTGHGDIPVAKGSSSPLSGNNFFPAEWQPPVDQPFGLQLPPHQLQVVPLPADSLITQLLSASGDDISILAFGPMTNIARVFIKHPELIVRVEQLCVSDGAVYVNGSINLEYKGIHNMVSGWNLWVDPRAAGIVFGAGKNILLVPLDMTQPQSPHPVVLSSGLVKRFSQHAGGSVGGALKVLMNNWIGSYQAAVQPNDSLRLVPVWDLVAALVFHHPEIGNTWQNCRISIDEGDLETAGRIVLVDSDTPNTNICLAGNQALFDSLLYRVIVDKPLMP